MRKKIIMLSLISISILLLLAGCNNGGKGIEDTKGDKISYFNLHYFNATTVNNKCLNEDYFKDYDICAIYFWAANSELSSFELQNYASFTKRLPKNIGSINVVLDSDVGKNYGKCLKDAHVGKMPSVLYGDNTFKCLCDQITELPTTIFVNSNGDVVGNPIIGIQLNGYEFDRLYLKEINHILKKLGKEKIKLKE